MSNYDFNAPAGALPPQDPGIIDSGTPSKWPTVVGTIGIVLGSLGILYHICAAIGSVAGSALLSFASAQAKDPSLNKMGDIMSKFMLPTAVLSLLGLGMAIWLLVSSIALVRRRPGAALLRPWAFAQCVMVVIRTVVGAWISVQTTEAMQKALTESGKGPPGGMPMTMDVTFQLVQAAVGGILMLAFPIFVAVWFSRGKIRDEIASWRVPESHPLA